MASEVIDSLAVRELKIGSILHKTDSNCNSIIVLPDVKATTRRIQFQNRKGGIVHAFDSQGNRYKRGADKRI